MYGVMQATFHYELVREKIETPRQFIVDVFPYRFQRNLSNRLWVAWERQFVVLCKQGLIVIQ